MLNFQLRLVACFFICCASLAFGLNALLLLERATSEQKVMAQAVSHDGDVHFEWIGRNHPDEVWIKLSEPAEHGFPAALRTVTLALPDLISKTAVDFSESPSILLCRPPPVS